MEHKEYLERRDERREPRRRYRKEHSSGIGALGIIGGIALIGVAALIITSLPDIKRYIKISTM
jgi:hypothetical protein